MTDTGDTSAQAGDQQEKAAAVGFVAFMGLALGLGGVLVAALAVAVERTWSGGAAERRRAGERSRGWLAEQRAWLEADHRQRMVRRRRRQDWLASGADPDTEPAKPRRSRRMRDSIRRAVANIALGGADFLGGLRDGWRAAQHVRRNGGSFRAIAKARPQICSECEFRIALPGSALCEDCARDADPPADRPRLTDPGDTSEPAREDDHADAFPDRYGPPNADASRPTEPATTAPTQPDEGDEMSEAPATTPSQAPAESNAQVLAAKLDRLRDSITAQADEVDSLRSDGFALFVKVREAADFAVSTGQSARSVAATDAAAQAGSFASSSLQRVRDQLENTRELLAKAVEAQQIIANAEEALRAEGADHRAVAETPA